MNINEIFNDLLILREHCPKGRVDEKYVAEFHRLLSAAQEETELDLSSFFIPESAMEQRVTFASFDAFGNPDQTSYSKPRCDGQFFLMKLDGVISRLAPPKDSGKRPIGF